MSRWTLSPEVQAVFDRLGYYIRHYPELSTLTGNSNFSIVFSRLLFHEDLRLKQHAAFFAGTDSQLASECGIGEHQFASARDLLCAPGIALFTRERHGVPAINHYRANYERIHAWLSANRLPQRSRASLPENRQPDARKTAYQTAENTVLLKERKQENTVDDDARQARVRAADALLKEWGVENPSRRRILERLGHRTDLVDAIREVCEGTSQQWADGALSKRGHIQRPIGLIISRLLHEVEP